MQLVDAEGVVEGLHHGASSAAPARTGPRKALPPTRRVGECVPVTRSGWASSNEAQLADEGVVVGVRDLGGVELVVTLVVIGHERAQLLGPLAAAPRLTVLGSPEELGAAPPGLLSRPRRPCAVPTRPSIVPSGAWRSRRGLRLRNGVWLRLRLRLRLRTTQRRSPRPPPSPRRQRRRGPPSAPERREDGARRTRRRRRPRCTRRPVRGRSSGPGPGPRAPGATQSRWPRQGRRGWRRRHCDGPTVMRRSRTSTVRAKRRWPSGDTPRPRR